jgi:hypothetical protein
MTSAVDRTQEMLLKRNPAQGHWLKDLMNLTNKTPLGFLVPFPRLAYNVMRANFEHSPFKLLTILSKAERAKMAEGDYSAISKVITGSTMLGAAIYLNSSPDHGEKWYQYKIPGTQNTLDLRSYVTLAPYFFAADILNKARTDTLYKLDGAEVVAGLANVNMRAGTGLAILDAAIQGLLPSGASASPAGDRLQNATFKIGGQFLSGFLTLPRTLLEFTSQFGVGADRTKRDLSQDPFLGPIKNSLPFLRDTLPPAVSATKGEPPQEPFPAIQATGLARFSEAQTPYEAELDRLQFSSGERFTPSGDPKIDYLTKKYMGKFISENLAPLVQQPWWAALSDAEKGEILHEWKVSAQKYGTAMAMTEDPEAFVAKRDKKPLRQRMLEAEMRRQAETVSTGEMPPEPPEPPEAEQDTSGEPPAAPTP